MMISKNEKRLFSLRKTDKIKHKDTPQTVSAYRLHVIVKFLLSLQHILHDIPITIIFLILIEKLNLIYFFPFSMHSSDRNA